MSLNEYYEKKVRIVSKNGETFEGKVTDYFYPEDTRSMFLRKEEQMLQHDKKNNKKASSINKNK